MITSINLRKNREVGELSDEMGAISDIYFTMELMDLEHGTIRPIKTHIEKGGVFSEESNNMNSLPLPQVW